MNVEHSFRDAESIDAPPGHVAAADHDGAASAPARQSRLRAWVRKRRWFLICVMLPTLLSALYYGFVASDIYVSESRFVIKSPDDRQQRSSSLANLIQTTGLSGGQEQTNEVLGYVRSRDALRALDERVGIAGRYSDGAIDPISRFPGLFGDRTFEDLFRYYDDMVTARLDSETGMAVISTRGFTPQDAYRINAELLQLSEQLVNRLNNRARTTGIAEAQRQVDLATQRTRQARVELAGYRNAQSLLDPEAQAAGVLEIGNALTAQRAALEAQLEQMTRLTPQNPSIPALRNRVNTISSQIAAQDRRVTGSDSGIASRLAGYENLLVEQEFATESLTAANAALVQARAEAQSQQFYLERVVEPNLPDSPLLPRRLLSILVVFAAATCLYFIAWMFIVGILEHASDS